MDALGPYGLGVVFDIIDAVVLGNPGIHIVVTDRPKALRAELEAHCPDGWRIEPLLAPERDRLSEAAYAEPGERGAVLLDVVEPREEREGAALVALNTDREWLSGPRKCAVVVIAGKDAADADAGLLELQAKASDFWSVRTRVHRAVGADDERGAKNELLDRLMPYVHGDRAAAARWLDGRPFREDWVSYRLWRSGPARDAWLALAEESPKLEASVVDGFVETIGEPGSERWAWSNEPIGERIPLERWPRPTWPSGKLAPTQHALVTALGAALDRDGTAELYLLPEDTAVEALNEAVLTLGLLRESRYELVLHLDAREGLEGGIVRCLNAAGEPDADPGLIAVARRLNGALGDTDALILITEAESVELAFMRAAMPGRPLVTDVKGLPQATFCVCGSDRVAGHVAWAKSQLSSWAMGSMSRTLRPQTLPLDLRAGLARAKYVVLLVDSTWAKSSPDAWQAASVGADRIAGFTVNDASIPSDLLGVQWYGDLGRDEATASDRLERAARALAGEPVGGTRSSRGAAWPTAPEPQTNGNENLANAKNNEALIEELAKVFYDPEEARLITRRSGFGPGHIPAFTKGIVFWTKVVEEAGNGAIEGGVMALADAAAKLRPANSVFKRYGSPRIVLDSPARDAQPPARADDASLELEGYAPLPENPAPSQYLVARYGVVEFEGREHELADLDAWAARPGAVAVRLVHGPGGAGKTRLLLEWVKRRRDAGERAGFLRDEGAETLDAIGEAQQATVVIDYAETRSWLFGLLCRLAPLRTRSGHQRVRVVLLARNAGDWWASLLQRDEDVRALLADSPLPLSLEPLLAPGDRAAELVRAATAFAKKLGRPIPIEVPVLDDVRFARVLYVHMAALAAVEGLKTAVDQLLDGLLEHEGRFWLRRAGLAGGNSDRDVVATFLKAARASIGALTLRGGVDDEPQAQALVGRFSAEHCKRIVSVARELYPHSGDGWIGGLEPDLLGEALVRGLLADRAWPRWIDDAMVDADPKSWTHAFTVLGRIEDSLPIVVSLYPHLLGGDVPTRSIAAFEAILALSQHTAHSRLGIELAQALQREGTAEIARIIDRVPLYTTMLREVAVWIQEKLLACVRTEEERVYRLNHLAIRLAELGRREEAMAATEDAVAACHKLDEALPNAFLPHIATSLGNLGQTLSGLGQRREALAVTAAAVAAYRKLHDLSGAFLPELAASLNNLGNMLSDMGQREAALDSTQESLALRRKLAEDQPDAFLPDLATSLNNLGIRLSELGRREEALSVTEEAVAIRTKLAENRPDAFLRYLAHSLANLGFRLSELDRREEALAATEQAVAVFRHLTEFRRHIFLPDLAKSLNNLGIRLSELGRREGALAATESALVAYQELAQAQSDLFLPDLAGVCNNLGLRLSDLGRHEEALAAVTNAIAMYRKLAETYSDAFVDELARCLGAQGHVLRAMGRDAEASTAFRDGLECVWESFVKLPPAHSVLTEGLLQSWSAALGDQGPTVVGPRVARFHEILAAQPLQPVANRPS